MKLLPSVIALNSVLATPLTGMSAGEMANEEAVWSGDFEGYNFDAILAQSASPLAAELLALRDDQGDLSVEEMETIQLEQRGWFDDDFTREERRKKKLKQVMKMIFFLQADNSPVALEKYLYYGCYCFPDGHTKLFSGYGEPIDEVDRVCKDFQVCYRCVGIDYGQEECINSKGYEYQGLVDEDTGAKELVCKDNGKGEPSRCSRAQCECDKELSMRLAEMEIAWNPMYQGGKYGLYDRVATCTPHEERAIEEHHPIDLKCCGYYPHRTPYAYNGPNGIRNCCGSKTYDPNRFECCPGDALQSLGTCIY